MKLATPRWWYVRDGAPAPVSRLLLRPISWIWAWVTARRIARTVPLDPGVPVICVGNLTLGGAGKTPVVRALVTRLPGAHVLTRGHGGSLHGPIRVDPEIHTAREVGDEPLLLAADGPVWVSRDRVAGARAAAAAGARVVIMDDGHQNPSLLKTLSIVVVDGETRDNAWPLGDGSIFPSGPMREPLSVGLARADVVVIMSPSDLKEPDPELLAVFRQKPILIASLRPAEPPPSGPQVGFAGIGMPWKVETALKAEGCDLVDFVPFPDHFYYDEPTLVRLTERAAQFGAGLVTTEKDWVRLPPVWRTRVKAWPVQAVFEDDAALRALLSDRSGG